MDWSKDQPIEGLKARHVKGDTLIKATRVNKQITTNDPPENSDTVDVSPLHGSEIFRLDYPGLSALLTHTQTGRDPAAATHG